MGKEHKLVFYVVVLVQLLHQAWSNEYVDKDKREYEVGLNIADFYSSKPVHRETRANPNAMSKMNLFEGHLSYPTLDTYRSFAESANVANFQSGRMWQRSTTPKQAEYKLWPRGHIPIALSSQFTAKAQRILLESFHEFSLKTCIRFRDRDRRTDADYVFIKFNQDCSTAIGRKGGRQNLALNEHCLADLSVLNHLLAHVLGLFHESSRLKRDEVFRIKMQNMQLGAYPNHFPKYRVPLFSNWPIDIDSITNQPSKAFTEVGDVTIETRDRALTSRFRQRNSLSTWDVRKISALYKDRCEREPIQPITIPTVASTHHPATTSTEPSRRTQFYMCQDGSRVPINKKCDGFYDCSDGFDEVECAGLDKVSHLT